MSSFKVKITSAVPFNLVRSGPVAFLASASGKNTVGGQGELENEAAMGKHGNNLFRNGVEQSAQGMVVMIAQVGLLS